MIVTKQEALAALSAVRDCLDGLNVKGGQACIVVGNAYAATSELAVYVNNLPDPELEKPTASEAEEGEKS